VLGNVRENQIYQVNDGIEILNNKTQLVSNQIEKCHGHGILIISDITDGKFTPVIK
jgi:hypothetical protein